MINETFLKQWSIVFLIISLVVFFTSLYVTTWVILRLPEDYWLRIQPESNTPLYKKVIRNSIALILAIMGFLMLFLPGQGILTLVIALVVSDLPFKKNLTTKLIQSKNIQRALNLFRERFGKTKFSFPKK